MSGIREVNAEEVTGGTGNTRVSESITSEFMEARIQMAEVDPGFYNKPQFNMRQMLTSYVRAHSLPIKVFESEKKLYLERTDWEALKQEVLNRTVSNSETAGA